MTMAMTSDRYEDDDEYEHDGDYDYEHEQDDDDDDEGGRVQGIKREGRS